MSSAERIQRFKKEGSSGFLRDFMNSPTVNRVMDFMTSQPEDQLIGGIDRVIEKVVYQGSFDPLRSVFKLWATLLPLSDKALELLLRDDEVDPSFSRLEILCRRHLVRKLSESGIEIRPEQVYADSIHPLDEGLRTMVVRATGIPLSIPDFVVGAALGMRPDMVTEFKDPENSLDGLFDFLDLVQEMAGEVMSQTGSIFDKEMLTQDPRLAFLQRIVDKHFRALNIFSHKEYDPERTLRESQPMIQKMLALSNWLMENPTRHHGQPESVAATEMIETMVARDGLLRNLYQFTRENFNKADYKWQKKFGESVMAEMWIAELLESLLKALSRTIEVLPLPSEFDPSDGTSRGADLAVIDITKSPNPDLPESVRVIGLVDVTTKKKSHESKLPSGINRVLNAPVMVLSLKGIQTTASRKGKRRTLDLWRYRLMLREDMKTHPFDPFANLDEGGKNNLSQQIASRLLEELEIVACQVNDTGSTDILLGKIEYMKVLLQEILLSP